MTTRAFINVPVKVTAVQWTGDNLTNVQAFLLPASPSYQPTVKRQKPMEDLPASLQVNVPDHSANAQWPNTGPHFVMQTVPVLGWIVKRDDTGELSVVDRDTFAASYEERLGDGSVAAFPLGAPVVATHPRATTSDSRIAHSREPAADDQGSTIDREDV